MLYTTVVLVLTGLVYLYWKTKKKYQVPKLEDTWWGTGPIQQEGTTIRPFKIDIPDEILKDLRTRLNNALPFQPPLEGVNQHYGINTDLLKTVVEYWKNNYHWSKRQEFLNKFPQFKTNIQGLNIHFIHARPTHVPEGVDVLPLLLIHGWPGSVREFYDMIPILMTPQQGRNFVFEVVAPSLPGFAFSDFASKPGMNPAQIAYIFDKLMKRLNFTRYYVPGGDWGSSIATDLSVLYPNNVIAVHRNWFFAKTFFHWKVLLGIYFPSLFFTKSEINKMYPLKEKYGFLMNESGYLHLQATKPDTVGVGLRESPVGLAAYILEKFISWTNPAWKDLPDGGLTKKFTFDQLLDNVMIYWVTRSITTSARIYAEAYSETYHKLNLKKIPIEVPAGINRFSNELTFPPETILREINNNLVHLTDLKGGHFAAFEVPETLGKDIFDFVEKVRNL